MFRPMSRRFGVLLAMLVALVVGAAVPASATPPTPSNSLSLPGLRWASCQDIRASFPFAPDGVYPLLVGNTLLTVFCYDMAGTPREYIDLANTGEGANFSQYTAGGASPGTNVRTSYTRLRIDPATLTVDVGDATFATSTGRLQHSAATRGPGSPFVTAMPYATAFSCDSRPSGVGNIDLRGTPFVVADTFVLGGFAASGSANISQDQRTVDLHGGGYCGWINAAPGHPQPLGPEPGTFLLNLACAPYEPHTAQPGNQQYCIKLS